MGAMRQMVAEQRAQLAAAQAVAAVREDRAERDAAAAAAPVSAPASAPAPAAASSSSPRRAGSSAAVADSNGSSALMGPGPLFTPRTAADATVAEKKPHAAPSPQNNQQQPLVESEGPAAQGACCNIM
jgi:hypothetical protein